MSDPKGGPPFLSVVQAVGVVLGTFIVLGLIFWAVFAL